MNERKTAQRARPNEYDLWLPSLGELESSPSEKKNSIHCEQSVWALLDLNWRKAFDSRWGHTKRLLCYWWVIIGQSMNRVLSVARWGSNKKGASDTFVLIVNLKKWKDGLGRPLSGWEVLLVLQRTQVWFPVSPQLLTAFCNCSSSRSMPPAASPAQGAGAQRDIHRLKNVKSFFY